VGTCAIALLIAWAYAVPAKLASYRDLARESGMGAPPQVAADRPALVFVHGAWQDRVAARLAAVGMRVDSIRSALAYNSTCRVESYLEARERGDASAGGVDLHYHAEAGPVLRDARMPSGSTVRTFPGEVLSPSCDREASSDFDGAVALPPLLWQGDLPGIEDGRPMFVRDLGPDRNATLMARLPERVPLLLTRSRGLVVVQPYEQAETRLWRTPSAASVGP
jgi:hypothetical protein